MEAWRHGGVEAWRLGSGDLEFEIRNLESGIWNLE
jgi:hypothetical protein